MARRALHFALIRCQANSLHGVNTCFPSILLILSGCHLRMVLISDSFPWSFPYFVFHMRTTLPAHLVLLCGFFVANVSLSFAINSPFALVSAHGMVVRACVIFR